MEELDKEFKNNGLGNYKKNDTDIFEKIAKDGKLHTAIKNCDYMENLNKNGQFSTYSIGDSIFEYLTKSCKFSFAKSDHFIPIVLFPPINLLVL